MSRAIVRLRLPASRTSGLPQKAPASRVSSISPAHVGLASITSRGLSFWSRSPRGSSASDNSASEQGAPFPTPPPSASAASTSADTSAAPQINIAGNDPTILTADPSVVANGGTAVGSGATDVATEVAVSAASTWSDFFLQPAIAFLNTAHDLSGLPWWATIVVATIGARTLLLPVSLYTMRNSAKMAAIQDDLKTMRDEVMASMRAGNRHVADQQQQDQRDFMRAAGVSPGKVLLGPLVQFPVFISFFVAIRRLATTDPDFATGGAAWFLDLASKDTTYALPILAGVTLGAMTELGGDTGTKMTGQMKTVMRAVAVASVPMTAWFPSAVFCYWIPNNIFSIGLNRAAKVPGLRQGMGLNPDLSAIPGTRAAIQARKTTSSQPLPVTPEVAAVSYMRKGAPISDIREDKSRDLKEETTLQRPILFKSKQEAKSARASAKM
jgi:YidC/Oxa1 family membrane protein insertase